jgi:ketopantoate hydroxymethyltransferase
MFAGNFTTNFRADHRHLQQNCGGQILVTHDLIGTFPWFTPRFVRPRANCAGEIKSAVAAWKNSLV